MSSRSTVFVSEGRSRLLSSGMDTSDTGNTSKQRFDSSKTGSKEKERFTVQAPSYSLTFAGKNALQLAGSSLLASNDPSLRHRVDSSASMKRPQAQSSQAKSLASSNHSVPNGNLAPGSSLIKHHQQQKPSLSADKSDAAKSKLKQEGRISQLPVRVLSLIFLHIARSDGNGIDIRAVCKLARVSRLFKETSKYVLSNSSSFFMPTEMLNDKIQKKWLQTRCPKTERLVLSGEMSRQDFAQVIGLRKVFPKIHVEEMILKGYYQKTALAFFDALMEKDRGVPEHWQYPEFGLLRARLQKFLGMLEEDLGKALTQNRSSGLEKLADYIIEYRRLIIPYFKALDRLSCWDKCLELSELSTCLNKFIKQTKSDDPRTNPNQQLLDHLKYVIRLVYRDIGLF
jgi:hypothetical protein